MGWSRRSGTLESHANILMVKLVERYLDEINRSYTSIWLAFYYYENFMSHLVQKDENGEFFMALAMKEPLSAVSVNGIGPVVVPIFNNPDCYVGMKIGIAGDKMTMDEYVAIIKTLKYNQVSL